MAEKRFDANYTFKFNSVPFQNLFSPNQLRIDNWNKIVNQLSAQGNNLSQYLVNLNNWLFGTTTISYSTEDNTGFLQDLDSRIKENLSKIGTNSNAIITINSTLKNHTDKINDLEGETTNNWLEITNIYGQLGSHNTDISNLTTELGRLNSDLNSLNIAITGLRSEINSKVDSTYVDQQISEAKGYTDAKIVSVNVLIDSLKSNTVAGIKVTDNPTAEEITDKVKPYLGTAAQADTGTSVGQVPTIQPDGKLPKSVMPVSDGLIHGGVIERNKSDTEAIITPSDDFLAKYTDEVPGVDITITTETTKYSSVYFVVKNASNVTILGQENCEVGDWIIAQGVNGFDKIDNVDAVKSVNGMLGIVEIKPKDLILENYTTSELDDNNIYPTDSAQTGLSKLDKRVKTLEAKSSEALPNVFLEIADLNNPTVSEQAIIIEALKSITNNFTTEPDWSKYNEIILMNRKGVEDIRYYSLLNYEFKNDEPIYYQLFFNIENNIEYIIRIGADNNFTIIKNEYAKKSEIPIVYNSIIQIQRNGTAIGTFGLNSKDGRVINILVPTKVSDITNDSGYVTQTELDSKIGGINTILATLVEVE